MRYKIFTGVLAIVIMILSTFTYIYYSTAQSQQATINKMQGQAIVAWARQMNTAAYYYLNNATTNIDMNALFTLLRSISETAVVTYPTYQDLYLWMSAASDSTVDCTAAYISGAQTSLRYINPVAIDMIKDLAQKIQSTTGLIIGSNGPWWELTHLNGEDPIKVLQEKGILDSIIDGCGDIQDLSQQIRDIEPKFQ